MPICCTSGGGRNFVDDQPAPIPLPKEYLETYHRCRDFLIENTETRGAENWEIQEGSYKKDPYRLERSVYKLQIGKDVNDEKQVYCVRGRLRFTNATPQQILTPIVKLENRPAWDSQMAKGRIAAVYAFEKNLDCTEDEETQKPPGGNGTTITGAFNSSKNCSAGDNHKEKLVGVEESHNFRGDNLSDIDIYSEATQHADDFSVSFPREDLIKDKDGVAVIRNDLIVRTSSGKSITSNRPGVFNTMAMNADLAYLAYYGQPPVVAGRDLCLLRFYGEYDGVLENLSYHDINAKGIHQTIIKPLMLLAKSVVTPDVPEVDGLVRAELHESCYLFSPGMTPEGEFFTDVTYISSLNMNGNFPATFSNIVMRQQPSTLNVLRKRLGLGNHDFNKEGNPGEAGLACNIM